VRNPLYRGDPAKTEKLDIQFVGNDQTRLAAVLSGEADVSFYASSNDMERIRASGNVDVVVAPSIRAYLVHLPMELPEMQDHRVREALNYVVDRQALIDNIFKGTATLAQTSVGPDQVGYRPVGPLPYDPDKAAALFAEAGWKKNAKGILEKDGKPFPTIRYQASNGRYPNDMAMAQAITGYLTAAGIPVDLQISEFAVFIADAREHAAKEGWMTQMAWGVAVESAAMLCQVYNPANANDFGGYKDPVLVQACAEINSEVDLDKRIKLVEDTAEFVYKDFAAIFLLVPSYTIAVRKGVEGIDYSIVEYHKFANAVVN
jgi:peptide/nickel transport system substrate-binding protein